MRWIFLVLLVGCVTVEADDERADLASPALGTSRSAVTACTAGTWCVETAPIPSGTILHAVWASSASDVFAVGDAGTILRRTNNVWAVMASGTQNNLRGVWGSSSSDVWAVGVSQTVLHFDGTSWSPINSPSGEFNGVWGASAGDVWFVGSGVAVHDSAGQISQASFPGTLLSVSGTGPSDVWVTGESVNVRHYDGMTWTTLTTGLGSSHQAVLAVAPDDVWATTSLPGKEAAHWNGSKWTIVNTNKGAFNGLSALASNDIWGVGGISRVGHWDGTTWTVEQPFGNSNTLWGVTTVPGHAWLVGNNALIAHRSL